MAKYANLRYEKALDAIEEYIDVNEVKEGEGLPSERKIADSLGLSRGTVREALDALEREGKIYKIHGKGNFLAPKKYSIDISEMESFTNAERKLGNIPGSKVVAFQRVQAGAVIAKKLGILDNEEVYALSRVRLVNGSPAVLENAYIPVKYVPELEKYDFEKESLYHILRQEYNIEIFGQTLDIRLSNASEIEADFLKIEPKDLVFVEQGLAKDVTGFRVIEYSKNILPCNHSKYHVHYINKNNILVLNEVMLKMLCEQIDIEELSVAYESFDEMYWNKVRCVLQQHKKQRDTISFLYEENATEKLIKSTIAYVDYAFFACSDNIRFQRLIEEVEGPEVVTILKENTLVLKMSDKKMIFTIDNKEFDYTEFQKKYLFALSKNWDADKCIKFAFYYNEGNGKQEQ